MTPTQGRCKSRVAPYIPSYLEQGQKCVVCGDEATGLHYRAITCEGCKGFFRRVCQRGLQFLCKENENCKINKTTRNVCQRCRYLKCLANGMSADLVLNEVERSAKRELIERNRERKELEKVQLQVRRFQTLYTVPHLTKSQIQLVKLLSQSFCNEIDAPLKLQTNFVFLNSNEQFNLLLKEILRRTYLFANSISTFTELSVYEKEALLVKNRGWIEIQLLRTAHQIDLIDGSLISYSNRDSTPPLINAFASPQSSSPDSGIASFLSSTSSTINGLRLSELDIEPSTLIHDVYTIAELFQKLHMDNEQLAVLSAILIFQSDVLINNTKIENLNEELWSILQFLVEQNPSGGETPERVAHWPQLHIKVAQLRAVAHRHFSAFFNQSNAREFARLFA